MPAEPEITKPEPGFNALRSVPQYHEITKSYEVRKWKLTIKVQLPTAPTKREAEILAQKMDRIHDFYCGQAIGFMSVVKKIMKDEMDPFNPGRAMEKISAHMEIMDADLKRYTQVVQQLNPAQVTLDLS